MRERGRVVLGSGIPALRVHGTLSSAIDIAKAANRNPPLTGRAARILPGKHGGMPKSIGQGAGRASEPYVNELTSSRVSQTATSDLLP